MVIFALLAVTISCACLLQMFTTLATTIKYENHDTTKTAKTEYIDRRVKKQCYFNDTIGILAC